ncbi:MAG: DnaJ domain-containing protein [Bacteroidales bacterium]|nr:DnaJ domain-containing protein [Bacteroidales bacterium]
MNLWEYYKLLGLRQGATDDEIRKAYRRKALEFHPDRNRAEGAHDMFIRVTEAYDYLTSHPHGRNITEEEVLRNYQAWVSYRQAEARKRAEEYARVTYAAFRKSTLYKSTSNIDGTTVFLGLGLAVAVIFMTIFGYTYRIKRATSLQEEPSVTLALVSITIGIIYLSVSIIYLSAWIAQEKAKKKKKRHVAES